MKYREEIRQVVGQIVRTIKGNVEASNVVKVEARKLPEEDKAHFIEVVETELLRLYVGTIVNYRIKQSKFS